MLFAGANAVSCRGREPLGACRLYALVLSLVGEEDKDPVLPDRSTDASTQLVITVLVPEQATLGGCQLGSGDWISRPHRRGAVPTLISIQSRTNDLDEKAAVKIVGSALGGNFGQRPRETAIFSVVGIGDDFYVGDRILTGGDDRRSAPDGADGADAVDAVAVGSKLAAVGVGRSAIFRCKDTARVS